MVFELSSNIFSGPCFGDSTPSEASTCASPINSNASSRKLEKTADAPTDSDNSTSFANHEKMGSSSLNDLLLAQDTFTSSKTLDVDVTEGQASFTELGMCGASCTEQESCASSLGMDISDPFPATDSTRMDIIADSMVGGNLSPKKEFVAQVLVCAEDLVDLGDSGSRLPATSNATSSEPGFLKNFACNGDYSPDSQSDIRYQVREDGDNVHHEVDLTASTSASLAFVPHTFSLSNSTLQSITLPDSLEPVESLSELSALFKGDDISEGASAVDPDSPASMSGTTFDWTLSNRPTMLTGSPEGKQTHSSLLHSPESPCDAQNLPELLARVQDEPVSLDTAVNIDSPAASPAAQMIEIMQHSSLPSSPAVLGATGDIFSPEAEDKHVSGYPHSIIIEGDSAVDIPVSSPPSSSPPCASRYFPSSSPLPSSSPAVSVGTPPTSPVTRIETKNDSYQLIEFDEGTTLESRIEVGVPPTTQIENAHEAIAVTSIFTGSSIDPAKEELAETTEPPVFSIVSLIAEQSAETVKDPLERQESIRVPGPKRSTLAAQKVQHKKLAKPFRPLTLVQPSPRPQDPTLSTAFAGSPSGRNDAGITSSLAASTPPAKLSDDKIKHRTTRAAAQFKSPLSASMVDSDVDSVRPTPNIQRLERKLQLLKRAVKARENSEEEELERLIKKWTEAGREIAWEVWDLVKDNVANDSRGNPAQKRGFQESWGWEDAGDAKRLKTEERNWGWDVVPVDEREAEQEAQEYEEVGAKRKFVDDEDAPRHNLGVMLRELGIATEVLGWSEEEESFVDV